MENLSNCEEIKKAENLSTYQKRFLDSWYNSLTSRAKETLYRWRESDYTKRRKMYLEQATNKSHTCI